MVLESTSPSPKRLTLLTETAPPPRLDPQKAFGHEIGDYPWDQWERWAIAQGLDREMAGQARLLIREAVNHTWDQCLMSFCGWGGDDGRALFRHALRSPKGAQRQWDILMRTDGLRGDYPPRSTDWKRGYLRADALGLRASLAGQLAKVS
jgi:hypothetical protein